MNWGSIITFVDSSQGERSERRPAGRTGHWTTLCIITRRPSVPDDWQAWCGMGSAGLRSASGEVVWVKPRSLSKLANNCGMHRVSPNFQDTNVCGGWAAAESTNAGPDRALPVYIAVQRDDSMRADDILPRRRRRQRLHWSRSIAMGWLSSRNTAMNVCSSVVLQATLAIHDSQAGYGTEDTGYLTAYGIQAGHSPRGMGE
ncbi:hypothetical protein F5Y12DRAFT_713186 [Xylaria sp. FL1777]|nr:hypothetical protein F5Y12DRAFT_713186 [Xylaria sp. FL1777]